MGLLACSATAHADDLQERAWASFVANDHDNAYPLLASLAERESVSGQTMLFKGLIERQRGLLPDARASFQRGLEQSPGSMDLQMELAMTLAWSGDHSAAIALYDRVLAMDPVHIPAAQNKARVLGWMGRHNDAEQIYLKLLDRDPDNTEAMVGLATLRRGRLQLQSATALYQTVLDKHPNHNEARQGLLEIAETTRFDWRTEIKTKVEGEVSTFQSNQRLSWRASPELSFALGYGLEDIGADLQKHRFEVSATTQVSSSLTLSGGYSPCLGDGVSHRLSSGASLSLSPLLSVIGGVRVELADGASPAWLARGGLSLRPAERWSVLSQVFLSKDAQGQETTAVAATLLWRPIDGVWLGLLGSHSWEQSANIPTIGGEAGFPISDNLDLFAGYEHRLSANDTHTARLGLKGRF